ncbi:SusD/RagB family nutrient-binding outer membrane lipoprotein [uncultured Chitinophaga sp.]|uniref:SusD/RagB family nutrient-binding outer membrane lipoprotein n=1 Tax=uncultured Chitinophaga sp. TaxID=339340 RepID=UPI0025CE3EFA|nr:SusD/RagB family nutrient-binding outer membrane lipoprotein [uncultured Chitinophaga sp.]
MKVFNIKHTLAALAIGVLILPGCKKFLDVNDNPNASKTADVSQILPSAQAATAYVLGADFQIYGGIWGQFWAQYWLSSQYKSIEQYQPVATDFDRPWNILYSGALTDADSLTQKAGVAKFNQYAAIGYLLKAYTFQMLTDGFGDIPLKAALKGDANLSPSYDPQAEVYDTIFAYIDRAIALADPASDFHPTADDLIFGGDMEQWIRFGNTLKLRAYLRISAVAEAKASAGIAALYASGAEFLEDDALIEYIATGGNNNPLFAEMLGLGRTQNLIASATTVDTMNAASDPRVKIFYRPIPASGLVIGIPQGSYNTTPSSTRSTPSYIVGARASDDNSALAPVKFISAAESYFLQAEAVAKGYATGDAEALFIAGITASFEAYNVTGLATYLANAGSAQWPVGEDAQVQKILLQKYLAMCGNQNFEAWTEWRRTGYPNIFTLSEASNLGAGKFPLRMLYPNTEATRNLNFPGAKLVEDAVWWDVQ